MKYYERSKQGRYEMWYIIFSCLAIVVASVVLLMRNKRKKKKTFNDIYPVF